jgi:hypothetical protein
MNRIAVAAVLLCILTIPAFGLDTSTRVVGPIHTWNAAGMERFDPSWLQVKFVEGSNVILEGERFVDDSGLDLTNANRVLSGDGVLEVRPLFRYDRATVRAWKELGEARSGVVGPDLSLWFNVRVEGGFEQVARTVNELNALPAVEIAHPVAIPETAVLESSGGAIAARDPADTPDFTDMQDYLYDTPVGLDGPAAWAVPGGTGTDMKFIDVELCWTPDHEDFAFGNFFYEGGVGCDALAYEPHGTAVLGEVIGRHNGFGISGFAPDVHYGTVAVTEDEWPDVPHYFIEAADNLDPGDVWLIELQMYRQGETNPIPMEYLQANYDAIWNSVWALGIVCVEAAGNGSWDLDNPTFGGLFDRDVRDSGAIMCAAGTPTGRVAEWFTNYGSRIDAHAWGSEIVTTGYGDLYNGGSRQTRYTSQFGGTSGASPMVTGAALCLQGIAKANLGVHLDPIQLRALITDTGIDHLDPTKEIGPRPDLGAASEAVLALVAVPEDGVIAAPVMSGFPNPFYDEAEIRFRMDAAEDVRVAIFDASGRRIRTLVDGPLARGEQRLIWDGRDETGRKLMSGVYFYRIDSEGLKSAGRLQKIR